MLISKGNNTKNEILRFFAINGNSPIGDIAKNCNVSLPTATKFVDELISDELVADFGKQHYEGGRKPSLFGLHSEAAYFVGIHIKSHSLAIGIMAFDGELVYYQQNISFKLNDNQESLDNLCTIINNVLIDSKIKTSKIKAYCLSIPGRVDTSKGISYNYFYNPAISLQDYLEKRFNTKVFIDNDSRVMCYGEYIKGEDVNNYNEVLFINISWGVGMGMIINGSPYYGANGLAGEFGHVTFFENEIFCRCGKKGCIETEASGSAMHRLLLAKHNAGARSILSPKIEDGETITTKDLVQAANDGDMLMIEIIEEIGSKLGKGVAGLINIFNPQLVILGGAVAESGYYLLMSVESAIRKYSLSLVNQQTQVKLSTLGEKGGVIGACFIARDKVLGVRQ